MSLLLYLQILGFTLASDLKGCENLRTDVQVVVGYIAFYAYMNKLPFKVTSCWRPYSDGFSVSDTHQTYRAVDISVHGWSKTDKQDILDKVTQCYNHAGAYSYSDGRQRIIIIHDIGKGTHMHIQVKRRSL